MMRALPEDVVSGLTGSRAGEGILAHAWYDGEVVAADLPVESWSVNWDSARQVQGQLDIEVRDPDGVLAPWAVDDPLGVGGSRLQVIYRFGSGATVDLGWFRITSSDPVEKWRSYRVNDSTVPTGVGELAFFGERLEWVSGGATVPVQGDELTRQAVIDRLLAPESPRAGATVLSEVRRLLSDIVPVSVADGVEDASVSRTVVYEQDRMGAVEDLLDRIGCSHRMTGDGQLEVYPDAQVAPVWTLSGGDDGVLIDVRRSQRLDAMFNGAVSEGQDSANRPLIGRAFDTTGPLRWEGPHGRYPTFHSATGLLKTQGAVDADALTSLRSAVSQRSVVLDVTCLPHPGLQTGDWVTVTNPTVAGREYPLTGVVRQMSLSGTADGVKPMALAVECAFSDVQAVREAIRRAA
ncbi:MAG: hypothetical protein K0S70_215 [Microbacterium sp.]|jgi:hypothetical protein|nr:hypothetical protein [Microbacterium sp.]